MNTGNTTIDSKRRQKDDTTRARCAGDDDENNGGIEHSSSDRTDVTGYAAAAAAPNEATDTNSLKPSAVAAAVAAGTVAEQTRQRKRRKKCKDAPTRPLSAYNLFFREEKEIWMQERRDALARGEDGYAAAKSNKRKPKRRKSGTEKEDDDHSSGRTEDGNSNTSEPRNFEAMARALGSRWRNLPLEQRRRFVDMAAVDQTRYRGEMQVYKEKLVAETAMGAAYLKRLRLQREQQEQQASEAATASSAAASFPVPSQIHVPAAATTTSTYGAAPAFASLSGALGTLPLNTGSNAAGAGDFLVQQLLALQQQQITNPSLSSLGYNNHSNDVLQHQLLLQQHQQRQQQQQNHLQREQMILSAAIAAANQANTGGMQRSEPNNTNMTNTLVLALLQQQQQQTLLQRQQSQPENDLQSVMQRQQEFNQLQELLSQVQQQQNPNLAHALLQNIAALSAAPASHNPTTNALPMEQWNPQLLLGLLAAAENQPSAGVAVTSIPAATAATTVNGAFSNASADTNNGSSTSHPPGATTSTIGALTIDQQIEGLRAYQEAQQHNQR